MADGDEGALVSDMLRRLESIHLDLANSREKLRATNERMTACEAKMALAKPMINYIKNLMVDLDERVDRLERRRQLKDTPA
jgi:hypothetical protein